MNALATALAELDRQGELANEALDRAIDARKAAERVESDARVRAVQLQRAYQALAALISSELPEEVPL
jgi:hypothetical protein